MVLALGNDIPGYEALWETVPGLGVTRVPRRLMIITCLALAGLAALGLEWVLQHGRGVAALGAALVLVAVDLLAGVTAYRPTAADEGNRAYAALRQKKRGTPARDACLRARPPGGERLPLLRDAGAARAASRLLDGGSAEGGGPRSPGAQPCADVRNLAELGVRYLAVYGRPQCRVAGRLVARDGPIALYEAFMPVAW